MAIKFKDKFSEIFSRFKTKAQELWVWARANKLKAAAASAGIGFGLFLLLILSIYLGLFGKIPTGEELKEIKNPLATTIYSGNNEIIGFFYVQNRSNMDSSDVNEYVKNALIATEDSRFYEHKGIDYRSLGRVLFKSILLRDKNSGGGSTITQQLAKNVFGRKKRYFLSTPINKFREMMIARRLERVYTKDEILLLYLNTVPFGDHLYGLEKASQRFFNKKPKDLALEEAATLIGTLKASSYYNPKKNPENSLQRRNVVLSQMQKYGYIDSTMMAETRQKELKLDYTLPKLESSFAAFYKDYLRNEFDQWAEQNPKEDGSLYDLDIDGLKIYTTIHSSIQKSAEKAVTNQMRRLQKYFEEGWDSPAGKDSLVFQVVRTHPLYLSLKEDGIAEDSIKKIFSKKRDMFVWNGSETGNFEASLLDSIVYTLTTLQASTVAIHNQSGKIMAYVGGKDYGYSQYDNVQIPRQVGSTFKPIVYLSALQQGADPCDFYDNELKTYSNYEGWTPRNSDGKYGGSYSMYGALANSVNTVSVQVMFQAGIQNVVNLAQQLGITSPLPKVPSLVLGTAEVSLMEMVRAYAAIANDGGVVEPYSIAKIEDEDGKVLYQRKFVGATNYVADSLSVKNLQQMMTYVNSEGTGSRWQAYKIPFNMMAKTGTTQNNADGWYIAASPEMTIGAWVGTLDPRVTFKYTSMGSGSNTALPIVARIFGDLSMWNTKIISGFHFEKGNFPCYAYSELTAAEAELLPKIDSTNLLHTVTNIFQTLFGRDKKKEETEESGGEEQ